ncbi:MAG: tetratricopeptide repeat protein [Terriglobia bacterium]
MLPGESSQFSREAGGARDDDNKAPAARTSRWSLAALIATLALLAALPYLNTLHNGFVWDDSTQVLNNPYIRNFHHLREIFTTTVWSYQGRAATTTAYYRPLMMLLYLACFHLFGPVAGVFHLANVLLNVLVVIALFQVTERMFQRRALAFAAAAIFALHPIHSEPVAWIAAVTDLELAFFYLVTFWVFLGLPVHHPGRARQELPRYLAMALAFVLALLSKEMATTLPLLATIYEHLFRDDRSETRWTQKLSRYGVLWALVIVYLVFRVHFLALVKTARSIAPGEVLLAAVGLVGQYVGKFFWPVRLSAFYVFPDNSLWDLLTRVPGGLVAIGFLATLVWVLWRRARRVSFGVLWFVATLLPVLNPRWMPANVFSERYLYLPSVGLCWLVAWAVVSLFDRLAGRRAAWRWGLAAVLAVPALLCARRIFTRNRDWHDDLTFYTRTLASSPDSVQMLIDLGQVYYNRGDLKSAEREWLRARKIAPDYSILLDNLGALYTQQHRYDDAVDALQRCIQDSPDDLDAHVNLGKAYAQMGQTQPAEDELRTAVDLAPLNVRARTTLGEFYFAHTRYREAAEQFGRSLASIPTSKAYLGEGLAYFEMHEAAPAESDFRKAAALDPHDSRPHFVLGYFYGEMGRTDEAIKEYTIGFKMDPDNQDARAAFQKLKAHDPDGRAR